MKKNGNNVNFYCYTNWTNKIGQNVFLEGMFEGNFDFRYARLTSCVKGALKITSVISINSSFENNFPAEFITF